MMIVTKGSSLGRETRKVSKKKCRKWPIYSRKYQKYRKSRNDLKYPLRAFNKYKWAIFVTNLKIDFPQTKTGGNQRKTNHQTKIESRPRKDEKNVTSKILLENRLGSLHWKLWVFNFFTIGEINFNCEPPHRNEELFPSGSGDNLKLPLYGGLVDGWF